MKTVTAAILLDNGKIFIAKRGANDKLANKWEFPGGKVEQGETPEESLKREMQEEFGIDVSVGKYLGESIYHYSHGSILLLAYQIFWMDGEITPKFHDAVEWVSVEQLNNYDFAPADIPFVESLRRNDFELQP